MVSRQRNRRHLFGLCLLLLCMTVQAAPLQVRVEQQRVELGQPIWLTLSSAQTAVSLDTLDFTPWHPLVALPQAFYVNSNRDNTAQSLRLRVYPYHTGKLILPGLHFLHHTTPSLHLTVLPARDPVSHAPMNFACRVSGLHAWQAQQLIVRCQLQLHDAYALLTQAHTRQTGFRLLPLQIRKHTTGQGQSAQTDYQPGWVIYAERPGKQVLRLPPIEYVRDGVVTRRFYHVPLHLQIRALPVWLPGTIPVGQVRSARYDLAHSWLSTSVLSQLRLRVQLSGVEPSQVPDYAAQLHSNHQFMFYRARQQQHTRVTATGVQHTLDFSIPLVAHQLGLYRLPDLRLQYFDPVRGTLETHLLRGRTVVVVNSWIKTVLGLLCAGLLVWLGRRAGVYVARLWSRFRVYQQALAILETPVSYQVMQRGMRKMAEAEGWRANLSLLQWQRCMRRVTPLVEALPVAQLNAAVYGRGDVELEPCVVCLRRICRQRRRALT